MSAFALRLTAGRGLQLPSCPLTSPIAPTPTPEVTPLKATSGDVIVAILLVECSLSGDNIGFSLCGRRLTADDVLSASGGWPDLASLASTLSRAAC